MMENGNVGRYAGPDIAHAGSVELDEVFRICGLYVEVIRQKWPLESLGWRKREAVKEGRRDICEDLEVLRRCLLSLSSRTCTRCQDRHRMDFWV